MISVQSVLKTRATKAQVVNSLKDAKACRFGVGIIALSTPRVVKPKATAMEFNNLFGIDFNHVRKITLVENVRSYGYEKNVNAKIGKAGSEATFEAASLPKGYTWETYPCLKRKESDGTLYAVASYTNKDKTTFTSKYIVGNRLATKEESDFITEHLYQSKPSAKQTAVGIAEDEQVKIVQYILDNIVAIGSIQQLRLLWQVFD